MRIHSIVPKTFQGSELYQEGCEAIFEKIADLESVIGMI